MEDKIGDTEAAKKRRKRAENLHNRKSSANFAVSNMIVRQPYQAPFTEILETAFEDGLLYGSYNEDGNEIPIDDPSIIIF